MTGRLFALLRVFWNQKVLFKISPGICLSKLFFSKIFSPGIFLPGLLCLLVLPGSPGCAQKADIPQRLTGERQIEAMTRLDYIFDGQTAIRLLPAEMIIGQGVTQAEWSPDGRFVLAVRIPPIKQSTFAVPVSITIWNKTTRRSAELWNRRLVAPMLAGKTQWMANGRVGIFHWLWMEADENGNWGVKHGSVSIDTVQGVAREVEVGDGLQRLMPPDNKPAQIPADAPVLPGSIPSPNTLTRVSSSTLRVKAVKTILKQGDVEARITSLWLETGGAKPTSALLCADGEGAQVSPSEDAALFMAQSGVWVTPLQRMPCALFTTTVLATHQDDVKYRAWEVVQAVKMWNTTHKGVLPVPDAAIASLQSFIPSETDYEGFHYIWKGGALPANARPADTVVAEIVGPGGCAQIFADGHVAWKSSD